MGSGRFGGWLGGLVVAQKLVVEGVKLEPLGWRLKLQTYFVRLSVEAIKPLCGRYVAYVGVGGRVDVGLEEFSLLMVVVWR